MLTACERYLNAIHELVDGSLGPIRRAELELHLESCDGCRALANDLKAIATAAASLDQMTPPERVWQSVAAQLRADGRVSPAPAATGFRRSSVAVLALAAALVLMIAGSLYMLRGAAPSPSPDAPAPAAASSAPAVTESPAAGNAAPLDPVKTVEAELALTQKHFSNVVELSKKSDPNTAAMVQGQLMVVNNAIEKTRQALVSDPQNEPARTSLYELLKQKIQFLQDTIALMNEMRQGDAAGAAEIVESGKT